MPRESRPPSPPRDEDPEPWSVEDFEAIAAVLRARRGAPLPPHRLNLLKARLRARLVARGIKSFTAFRDRKIRNQPDGSGMQLLIDLTTVNHTTFFREQPQLLALAAYLADRQRSAAAGKVRVWSAGCSAGQEPYSLAMTLAELVPDLAARGPEILATDVSLEMVRGAARGIYAARDMADVSRDRLRRFFLRGRGPRHGAFRVAPEIRQLVTFQHFDLRSQAWPIAGTFDAILCRNVALYFEEAERIELVDRLAGRLKEGGWLVVGNCEIFPDRPGLLRKHAPSTYRRVTPP